MYFRDLESPRVLGDLFRYSTLCMYGLSSAVCGTVGGQSAGWSAAAFGAAERRRWCMGLYCSGRLLMSTYKRQSLSDDVSRYLA